MMRSVGGRATADRGGISAHGDTGGKIPRAGVARIGRFCACDRGAAAVEFGLATPLLLGLLVPIVDLGIGFSKQQQLRQAVQAGALYATIHPWNSNSPTDIANAVRTASALTGVAVTPTPFQLCGCPNGSAVTTVTCGTPCSNAEGAGSYVKVSAQMPYTPSLPYPLLGNSVTLTAQSMVRIR
jgi:Flp pilus assembly protein TadG